MELKNLKIALWEGRFERSLLCLCMAWHGKISVAMAGMAGAYLSTETSVVPIRGGRPIQKKVLVSGCEAPENLTWSVG